MSDSRYRLRFPSECLELPPKEVFVRILERVCHDEVFVHGGDHRPSERSRHNAGDNYDMHRQRWLLESESINNE